MDIQAHQLYTAKRAGQNQATAGDANEPKWLKTLPQVYSLTTPFTALLDQLPLVRATGNEEAMKSYYKRVVEELAKVLAFRVRIVELSDRIAENEKSIEINRLIDECNQYLAAIAQLLTYGRTSTE